MRYPFHQKQHFLNIIILEAMLINEKAIAHPKYNGIVPFPRELFYLPQPKAFDFFDIVQRQEEPV